MVQVWEEYETEVTGLPNGIRFVRFAVTNQKMLYNEVVGVGKKE